MNERVVKSLELPQAHPCYQHECAGCKKLNHTASKMLPDGWGYIQVFDSYGRAVGQASVACGTECSAAVAVECFQQLTPEVKPELKLLAERTSSS